MFSRMGLPVTLIVGHGSASYFGVPGAGCTWIQSSQLSNWVCHYCDSVWLGGLTNPIPWLVEVVSFHNVHSDTQGCSHLRFLCSPTVASNSHVFLLFCCHHFVTTHCSEFVCCNLDSSLVAGFSAVDHSVWFGVTCCHAKLLVNLGSHFGCTE